MIREGKEEGWLALPVEAIHPWASLNGIRLNNVRVGEDAARPERGAGVFATHEMNPDEGASNVVMTIPRDLILSKERIDEHAKVDKTFRTIVEALGEFGQSPRVSILTFLLTQSALLHPKTPSPFVHTPLTTYIRLLPLPPLPTFWPEALHPLLRGTTLLPALTTKLTSLHREFATFRTHLTAPTVTATLPWLSETWFSDVDPLITLDDWLLVDAAYRSRALDFPGVGHCMVPVLDMANHCPGSDTKAVYEVDPRGDAALLLLRDGQSVAEAGEVTITYGDDKGACEMVFSYGFLESERASARELFLDVRTVGEDPLGRAKREVARCAPGVKLLERDGHVAWEGDWVWLVVVNEEDGLDFMLQRTVEGGEELKAFWKGKELRGADELRGRLVAEPRWEIFELRAVSLLQIRVGEQLAELYGSQDEVVNAEAEEGRDLTPDVKTLILKLRELEGDVLESAYAYFEEEKDRLVTTDAVQQYLASMTNEGPGHPSRPDNDDEDDLS